MNDWLPIDIAASAMSAQRIRMNVLASNIANVDSTRTAEGGARSPYNPLEVVFKSSPPASFAKMLKGEMGRFLGEQFSGDDIALLESHLRGVEVKVIKSDRPPELRMEPGHPDADPRTGMVAYPSISAIETMTNMIAASRMYEANAATIKISKEMVEGMLSALRL